MELHVDDGKGGVKVYDPATDGGYYYVLCTPSHKVRQVKQFLENNSIEAIVPMHYQDVVRRGKTMRELVSAPYNQVYIKADLNQVRWIKKHLQYLTYAKILEWGDSWTKERVYIENEVVELFRLLESKYLDDFLIVDSEDVSDDNFTQINTANGVFKDIPLLFENVKGVDHKCLTMVLDYNTVIAVKSLTPESFMMQECEMSQIIDGKCIKTHFPLLEVAN